jgi:CRP-like cAMP-binding protein
VRELGRGSGIGEIALLHGVPRTASAMALTPVTAYALEREAFLTSLQGHAPSHATARAVADDYLTRDADPAGPRRNDGADD